MIFRKATHNDFNEIYEIMEQSFPEDERRPRELQYEVFSDPDFSTYVICEDDSILGFITVWKLDDFIFVEHLAIAENHRNKGLGSTILTETAMISDKRLCLEVELPCTEIARRRIGFYERHGFYLNLYEYFQPAYSKNQSPIPLLIMTTNGKIDKDEFENLRYKLYRKAYGLDL